MKYKLIKHVYNNGEELYTIRKQVFPFIWVTESCTKWTDWGCRIDTPLNKLNLDEANMWLEKFKLVKQYNHDRKIKNTETVKILDI